jgi:arginyl-tRNA--protein-N-Asp/Glu arginylyltransferase
VTSFFLSVFIPYCFRTTDHPEERRRLYREYQKTQHPMIQKVLSVPDFVQLEEKYWINSRYVEHQ